MSTSILIVDDEIPLSKHLAQYLAAEGYLIETVHTGADALAKIREFFPEVVLLDLKLPDINGQELLPQLKKESPDSEFIVITAYGSIRSAVDITRRGAADYLTKPFEMGELTHAIASVMRGRALGEEVRRLRQEVGCGPESSAGQAGERRYPSEAMTQVYSLAARAAEMSGIVLLLGESGTGKDRLARWIHNHSQRSDGPYFHVNCAAVTAELAESELFGHEPGAFTGARKRRKGLFEVANKGTLLLNEIGELEPRLQSKLLTFLDTSSFLRVGGERYVSIDARVFAATNRELLEEVERGAFRKDLYYRLNVLQIRLPSLRERLEDLPLLVEEILDKLRADMALPRQIEVTASAHQALASYHWPGNVRELRNVLERAVIVSDGRRITPRDLNLVVSEDHWQLVVPFPTERGLHEVTKQVARQLVSEALRRAGTKQEAAKLLGISRHALAHQIKVLGVEE